MEITIQDLQKITDILIRYIKKNKDNIIKIDKEDVFYQKVWHADRNFDVTPSITIGDVDEDIEALKLLITKNEPNGYDLERLGALFTILGATFSKG